jgi:hypothetical protein
MRTLSIFVLGLSLVAPVGCAEQAGKKDEKAEKKDDKGGDKADAKAEEKKE